MKKNYKIIIPLCLVIVIKIIFYVLMNKIASLNPNIILFDLRVFYSPTLFYDNILLYTNEIEKYLMIFRAIDMIFPFTFAILFIQLFRKLESKHILFPLIALFSDLFENILLSYKMFHNTLSNDFIIYIINAVTLLKFLSLLASVGFLIILFIKKRKA